MAPDATFADFRGLRAIAHASPRTIPRNMPVTALVNTLGRVFMVGTTGLSRTWKVDVSRASLMRALSYRCVSKVTKTSCIFCSRRNCPSWY